MEGETDASGRQTLFMYYNQRIPETLELPAGEDEVTFLYIVTMSTVEAEASDDFFSG